MSLKRIWNAITGKPPNVQALPPAVATIPPTTSTIGGYTGRVSVGPTGEVTLGTQLPPSEQELADLVQRGLIKTTPTLFQTPAEQATAADELYNQIVNLQLPEFKQQLAEARAAAEAQALASGTIGSDIGSRRFQSLEQAGIRGLNELYLQGRITADQLLNARFQQRMAGVQQGRAIQGEQFGRAQTALETARETALPIGAQQQGINAKNEAMRQQNARERQEWLKNQIGVGMAVVTAGMGVPAGGGGATWSLGNYGLEDIAGILGRGKPAATTPAATIPATGGTIPGAIEERPTYGRRLESPRIETEPGFVEYVDLQSITAPYRRRKERERQLV